MFVFGPLPGVAVMAGLVSHVGTCCIGINCDGAVFADTNLLMTCLREGLDEVLALAKPHAGNTRRRRGSTPPQEMQRG